MENRWQSHKYFSENEKLQYESFYNGRFDGLDPQFVMFIDLDNFHLFNKKYGHEKGDILLKEIWVILNQKLGGKSYVLRYGGEEFLALLNIKSQKEVIELARGIQTSLQKFESATKGKITVSIGIGRYTPSSECVSEQENFYRIINAAQHEAKIQGRNKIIFVSENQSEKDSYQIVSN